MKCIVFEWKKVYGVRLCLISLILIAICGVSYSFVLENQDVTSWQEFALSQKNEYQSLIEQSDTNDEFYKEAYSTFKREIIKIDFCIENNIPYGCQTVWSFLFKSEFLLNIVLLSTVILSSNIFSVETTAQMLEKIISSKHSIKKLLRSGGIRNEVCSNY